MDINAQSGTKVVFAHPKNGWDGDVEVAAKHLKVGEVYTVVRTDVHGWHTNVYLEEVPDIGFNSVQFDNVKKEE